MLRGSLIVFLTLCVTLATTAQRIAVLTPDNSPGSQAFAERVEAALADRIKLIDGSMAASAFNAAGLKTPFNLTTEEAKRVGHAIGCEFFVLVRSAVQRRSSFERPEYYEAYAAVFLVSARTGRLVSFVNDDHVGDKPQIASGELDRSIPSLAEQIASTAKRTQASELDEAAPPWIDEPPDPASPAAKGFKAPVPFRRLKPDYSNEAALYDVTATVDILVDLSSDGKVVRTDVTRWAGYGLDESAVAAIRSMNWRPAERDGKFLPMRFLVRYNFKKPDKP